MATTLDDAPVPPVPAARLSALAVWSLVLGLLGLVCLLGPFTGVPAIVCGAMGLSRIRDAAPALRGSGMALAGLILGAVATVVSLVMLPMMAAIAVPAFVQARGRAQEAVSAAHARQYAVACMAYAEASGGELPAALEDLAGQDVLSDPLPRSPWAGDGPDTGYALAVRGRLSDGADLASTPLLYDTRASPLGHRVVAFLDGHVAILSAEEAARLPGVKPALEP